MKNLRKYAGAQRTLNGEAHALVVRDVYSTFGAVYPARAKNAEETTAALRVVVGDSKIKRFHSDRADELVIASRDLGAPHEASR